MKNGCVLLSVYIIILLSSVELRADEINNVYKTVQQLPIEQCDENGNLWDFRDVVITGDSRIRIRNFGDSIIDRTSIFERNDFSRNGDSIFIIGFENYKYDLSCDSPQYLFNISDDGTRKTSYNLTGKAFRQYPVYLSGEVEIERSNQGAILMPAGNTITVKANVILTGKLATDDLAQVYKQGIYDVWGEVKKVSFKGEEYDVVWDVDVRVMASGEKKVFDGVNNYMEVFDPDTRTPENRRSKVRNSKEGEIRSKSTFGISLEYDNPMPHELGHMLGLMDRYEDGDPQNNYRNDVMKEQPIDILGVSLRTQFNLFMVPIILNRTFGKEIPYIKRINVFNSEKYMFMKSNKQR